MPRYRLVIEYDGGPFSGFQAQGDLPTVQSALERAIGAFSGEIVRVHAAGRTDAGVHATGQVIHFDLERDFPARTVQRALNAHLLPAPVAVREASLAAPDFHARFSAQSRRYVYRILNRDSPATLDFGRVWAFRAPLDAERMASAAAHLVGRHDFTTFRDAHCQARTAVKTLDTAEVSRHGEELRLIFEARSFLHRQVRSMTGSLVEVGRGRWSVDDFVVALAARRRAACGPVAPATGLYLAGVRYPAENLVK